MGSVLAAIEARKRELAAGAIDVTPVALESVREGEGAGQMGASTGGDGGSVALGDRVAQTAVLVVDKH